MEGVSVDLKTLLPVLLPRAIEWATTHSEEILKEGRPLSAEGIKLATAVGVSFPAKVRVSEVTTLPIPSDPQLRNIALETGLLGPGIIGLTLGYGIYIRSGCFSNKLISHECRHVYQYETAGSIDKFLPMYLQQVAMYGYRDAPFEIDARMHEKDTA